MDEYLKKGNLFDNITTVKAVCNWSRLSAPAAKTKPAARVCRRQLLIVFPMFTVGLDEFAVCSCMKSKEKGRMVHDEKTRARNGKFSRESNILPAQSVSVIRFSCTQTHLRAPGDAAALSTQRSYHSIKVYLIILRQRFANCPNGSATNFKWTRSCSKTNQIASACQLSRSWVHHGQAVEPCQRLWDCHQQPRWQKFKKPPLEWASDYSLQPMAIMGERLLEWGRFWICRSTFMCLRL